MKIREMCQITIEYIVKGGERIGKSLGWRGGLPWKNSISMPWGAMTRLFPLIDSPFWNYAEDVQEVHLLLVVEDLEGVCKWSPDPISVCIGVGGTILAFRVLP